MSRPIHTLRRKRRGFRGNHHIRECSGYSRFASQDVTSVFAYEVSMESTDVCSDDCGGSNATLIEGPFGAWELRQFNTDLDLKHYAYWAGQTDRLNRAERRFVKRQAGAIVHQSSDGFVDVRWYEDKNKLESVWESVRASYYPEDEEPNEPEEGDITTEDHIKFYQYGELWLDVGEDCEEWRIEVIRQMNEDKFWPSVWWISDHGNSHLCDMSYNA